MNLDSTAIDDLQRTMQADFDLLVASRASDDELRGALAILRAQAARWGVRAPKLPQPTYTLRPTPAVLGYLRLLPTAHQADEPPSTA